MKITRATAVVDTHTGGEPTRLIIGGAPYIPGKSISEKWVNVHKNFDDFRIYTTCEPRGHGDMVSALFVPPVHEEAHFGIIFLETGGGITMCGHGSIGLARLREQVGAQRAAAAQPANWNEAGVAAIPVSATRLAPGVGAK